jgi:hypothetical protein
MKMSKGRQADFLIIYAVTFLAFLMSKGLALVPAMGLDDYVALHQDRNPLFYLWQGRFTQAIIQVILTNMGISPTSIAWPVIILFFGFASWAITLGILYVATNRGQALGLAAIGAVIASHPYLTEYFTFRESLITQGTSFLLISLVLVVAKYDRIEVVSLKKARCASLLLAMVALAGAQQSAFIILGFFLAAGLVQQVLKGNWSNKFLLGNGRCQLILLYLLAVFFYILLFLTIRKATGVPIDQRSSIIGFEYFRDRATSIFLLTYKLLVSGEPILSAAAKWYSYSVFLLFLLLAGLHRRLALLLIVIVAVLFYIGSIFLVGISGVWWPVPRAVYGLGFAFGICLMLAYINAKGRLLPLFPYLAFVAAVVFSFHSSIILYDQIRLNRWDAWVANSVAQELLRLNANPVSQVVLVGAPWRHPVGLATIDGDLNSSALAVPWAANHLFMEVTGRHWRIKSMPTSSECNGIDPWPNSGSTRLVKDEYYICMGSQR